jgi:uncharacterized protein DUF1569
MTNPLRFTSLADAEAELAAIEKAENPQPAGPWSLAKIFDHCAASIRAAARRRLRAGLSD